MTGIGSAEPGGIRLIWGSTPAGGSRLPARLYRGRHFRRHGFVRFQGATRSTPNVLCGRCQSRQILEIIRYSKLAKLAKKSVGPKPRAGVQAAGK